MDINLKKLIIIGHVDTGKSTLLGNILYSSGNIDEHYMNNIKKEAELNKKKSFQYAYLLDTDDTEKQKGVTQSYNIIDFNYNNNNYRLIDTPGHKMYIKEMIEAITTNNDSVVCLLVSCVENEFNSSLNSGTLKEDLLLIRGSGVENIMVLVNKIDLIESDKLNESYNNVINKLNPLINKFKFKNINYLPISGYNGWNLFNENKEINSILKPKYDTLINYIDNYNYSYNKIEKKYKLKNKIKIEFNAYNLSKVIPVKYNFILHLIDNEIDNNELEGELLLINSLDNKNKMFIINNEKVYIGLKLNRDVKVFNTQRVIFRDNENNTIGFGKIIIDENKY